jgi:hypothetical protein
VGDPWLLNMLSAVPIDPRRATADNARDAEVFVLAVR